MHLRAVSVAFVAFVAVLHGTNNGVDGAKASKKPNIILIMTDDQDKHMHSLDYQPSVKKHFIDQGTTFEKHFCTMAQCCPSRVSFLTGMAGHNTNVTDVKPPYGGYPRFVEQGFNSNYLPVWLQDGGYNTYYVGKFMNSHGVSNYNNPYPGGWNGTDFLIEPNIYWYYNATWQRNKNAPYYTPGEYSTDLVAKKAVDYLGDAVNAKDGRPFFMAIMPIGPHTEIRTKDNTAVGQNVFYPPAVAKRHENLYSNAKIPRTANFNPDVAGSASYLKTLPKLNDTVINYLDDFYRKRLQALASVDDLIDDVFAKLEKDNLLENTYVFYTADNGYHMGQHRMQAGKTTCFEEDINIPLMIRGPGVKKGVTVHYPTTHTDLVPTMFKLAGLPLREDFDGAPIPVIESIKPSKYEQVNIEFWGGNREEGEYGGTQSYSNNTFKALRLVGSKYDLLYTTWCTNEHELYDMKHDAAQMNNLYGNKKKSLFGHPVSKVTSRLNGLMMVMKSCKGNSCVQPWKTLHPSGDVTGILDAMDSRYDDFYEKEMPQVSFDKCASGYIIEVEGPQEPAVCKASDSKRAVEEDNYSYKMGDDWAMWA